MVTAPNGAIRDSVTRVETNGVSAGIRWGALGVDMVPIFEETTVRIEQRYTTEEWARLDPMEKAIMIAQKRISNAIQNIQSEAEMRRMKQEQRKK